MRTEAELLDAMGSLIIGRRQLLAAAAVAVATAAQGSPSLPARLRAFGVFSPMYAGGVRLPEYVTWLGRSPLFVADNTNETGDWNAALSSVWYLAKKYKPLAATIVLGIPLLPKANSGQFVAGNRGDFDLWFTKIANSLKGLRNREIDGQTYDVVIRLGWEFNGDWMPWYAGRDITSYKAFFRRVVGLFRAVDPDFRFDWCATLGNMNANTFDCYPGDDVVNFIGADVYDETWNALYRIDVKARWKFRYLGGNQGLVAFRDFAKAHGKQLSFPEWGCRNRASWDNPQASGGDNPYFIEEMAAWFDGLGDQLAYQCYFERADVFSALSQGVPIKNADGTVMKTPTPFPNAATKFKALFGP